MKILITGASGFVGKELLRALFSSGHQLVVLTRSFEQARAKISVPCEIFQWDWQNGLAPAESFEGVEAVVNLMGENIAARRWTAVQRDKIFNSRVQGTKNLAQSILQYGQGVHTVISTSAIGIYPTNLPDELHEQSPLAQKGLLPKVCRAWEEALAPLSALRVVVIRTGVVLGKEGGMLAKLIPLFQMGAGGPIGLGRHTMSWIHLLDLVKLYQTALEDKSFSGVYNGVAPNPVSNRHFTKALAKSLEVLAIFPVPPLMLKICFGRMSTIMLDSQKVISKKLDTSFFNFPNIEKSCDHIANKTKIIGQDTCPYESFRSYQFVPQSPEDVFTFFSHAKNLEKITPPSLKLKIIGPPQGPLKSGDAIDYQIKLWGFPMRCRALIQQSVFGQKFVDFQLKGPYKVWHHTHNFRPVLGGTLIEDEILYLPPFGKLGRPFGGAKIRAILEQVFAHRKKALEKIFSKSLN